VELKAITIFIQFGVSASTVISDSWYSGRGRFPASLRQIPGCRNVQIVPKHGLLMDLQMGRLRTQLNRWTGGGVNWTTDAWLSMVII
jgi:hypothetical protein